MTGQTEFIIHTGKNHQQYEGMHDEVSEKEILVNFENFHDGKNSLIL